MRARIHGKQFYRGASHWCVRKSYNAPWTTHGAVKCLFNPLANGSYLYSSISNECGRTQQMRCKIMHCKCFCYHNPIRTKLRPRFFSHDFFFSLNFNRMNIQPTYGCCSIRDATIHMRFQFIFFASNRVAACSRNGIFLFCSENALLRVFVHKWLFVSS